MPANGSPLCLTPSGSFLPISPPNVSLVPVAPLADVLLENPPDLVCPITHELFSEPVINGAGQVYERSAIEVHMRRSNTDPVTRMQLHPASPLTPVFIVKSRSVSLRCKTPLSCYCRFDSVIFAVQSFRLQREHCTAMHSQSMCQSRTGRCQVLAQSYRTLRWCNLYCAGMCNLCLVVFIRWMACGARLCVVQGLSRGCINYTQAHPGQ